VSGFLADLAFTARVYGICDDDVYLTADEASLTVPIATLGRRPQIGERIPVSIRIGGAP
jgi:hypothetical protein